MLQECSHDNKDFLPLLNLYHDAGNGPDNSIQAPKKGSPDPLGQFLWPFIEHASICTMDWRYRAGRWNSCKWSHHTISGQLGEISTGECYIQPSALHLPGRKYRYWAGRVQFQQSSFICDATIVRCSKPNSCREGAAYCSCLVRLAFLGFNDFI